MRKFIIIALSPVGKGLSGGDRIFIELSKNLDALGKNVEIITWSDGKGMCEMQHLDSKTIKYKLVDIPKILRKSFLLCYLTRIFYSIFLGLSYEIDTNSYVEKSELCIYSASDFWMDVFPCYLLKMRYKSLIWLATWYQTAPKLFQGYSQGKRENEYKLNAFFPWFSQLIIRPFITQKADYIIVNNEEEKKMFPVFNKMNKLIVLFGGIDKRKIENFKKSHKLLSKKYEAVFQGRFHAQKGVIELIEIWEKVVKTLPLAKLVMIGDGYLMQEVKDKIIKLGLTDNIILKGYVFDGEEKYTLFSQSKIAVHPAYFDSGGMAAGEAMAFGLPCVGFNLISYESYYPKGMIKVKINDKLEFSKKVIQLLKNKRLREKMGKEALLMTSQWDWKDRVNSLLKAIENK